MNPNLPFEFAPFGGWDASTARPSTSRSRALRAREHRDKPFLDGYRRNERH